MRIFYKIFNGNVFAALLTDLSKAFDCISHDLMIAKLDAYNLDLNTIRYVADYLSSRKQKVKINGKYSEWSDLLTGVPQGSILGPLLFNIYICDIFMTIENQDFASYADDTTPFVTGNTLDDAKYLIEGVSKKLFKWFSNNQLKANPNKYHLILNCDDINASITVQDSVICNSKTEKLLSFHFDNYLKFDYHIDKMCKQASNKMHALSCLHIT